MATRADLYGARRRWAIAAIGGVLLAALVSASFAPLPVPIREPQRPVRQVFIGQGSEATAMRDLTPLFLPTWRNAASSLLPEREPGEKIGEVETPRLGIAEAGWRVSERLPELVTLNGLPVARATPLDYLDDSAADVLVSGIGRSPRPLPVHTARAATIEAVATRDGRRLLADVLPPTVSLPTDKAWLPLELLANVGPAGLVAPLTVTSGSGVEDVDAFFRNYLARTFRVGERLPPGFYRITVAP
jgi:hypothetical protein